ncbi:hypothetical protein ACVWWG_003781 [Bradyrhizobium sp. LB7.2]
MTGLRISAALTAVTGARSEIKTIRGAMLMAISQKNYAAAVSHPAVKFWEFYASGKAESSPNWVTQMSRPYRPSGGIDPEEDRQESDQLGLPMYADLGEDALELAARGFWAMPKPFRLLFKCLRY